MTRSQMHLARKWTAGTARTAMPALLGAVLLLAGSSASAQTQAPNVPAPTTSTALRFEVASVRPNASGKLSMGIFPGGRFEMTNYQLRSIIQIAYMVGNQELVNVPDWAAREHFDIIAQAPGDFSEKRLEIDTVRGMLRTLLAERFGLVLREETRQLQVYALVVDRPDGVLGPNLRRVEPCDPLPPLAAPVTGPRCGVFSGPIPKMTGRAVTMRDLAATVKPRVEAPIIDRTGLEGAFDLEMEFERDLFAQNSPLPNIFTAMREQLGLRLQSETAPVVVLVVEEVHRPTPN